MLRIFFKYNRRLLGDLHPHLHFLVTEGGVDEAGVFHKKIVAFLTDFSVVDRIINHLKLTFVATKPPPSHVFTEVTLMAAEERGRFFTVFDSAARPVVVFHHNQEGRFIARSGKSPRRGKSDF